LYDADYHNRVLRDELERMTGQLPLEEFAPKSEPRESSPRTSSQTDGLSPDSLPDMPSLDGFEVDDFDLPQVDEGTPVTGDELMEIDGALGAEKEDRSPAELMPPPGGPEPPGKEDLEFPPIVPGELVPPPGRGEEMEKPPGQIQLPESVGVKANPVPKSVRIHKGLSGGHQFDGDEKIDGMHLVINAVDSHGKTVDLSQFDIDAKLTVVALDPQRSAAEARIGRWEFTAEEVIESIRSDPTSGLYVQVRWQESKPLSEEVIVHVRLRAEDDAMQCESRLNIGDAARVANWTPRGEP
jgi:hypothetical protein